ncbi:MAG: hypothetical protein LC800_09545 [Acidobacteria bacterium]|nr:hypothetical protein [Acidobacteriota bacterium]
MNPQNPFVGNWTYRSFINDPTEVGDDAQKALNLIFGEGQMTIEESAFGEFKGTVSFGDPLVLDLRGWAAFGSPFAVRFQGVGRKGGGAEGWVYDYLGYLVPDWPNGVDQTAAIVGSVIRTVPHSDGKAKAGYVASFVAVAHD